MSNDNILNKLRQKNRQRANVSQRQDPLFHSQIIDQESAKTDSESQNDSLSTANSSSLTSVGEPPEKEPSNSPSDEQANQPTTVAELKQQLAQFPTTRRRSGIVLEEELDLELTTYCKKKGITVETFLEAAWSIVSAQETLLEQVTAQAKSRYRQRKEAGQLRRLITALEKRP
jgi:hypothetical protein